MHRPGPVRSPDRRPSDRARVGSRHDGCQHCWNLARRMGNEFNGRLPTLPAL